MWLDRQQQKIHGSGRSNVMVAPEDIAKIKTDLLYDNYLNWHKSNRSQQTQSRLATAIPSLGTSMIPGNPLRIAPEGSHAATRPLETYLDDIPSLALQLGLLGRYDWSDRFGDGDGPIHGVINARAYVWVAGGAA